MKNVKKCVYNTKKAGLASFEKLWTLDYSEQGEKMQRVVATRMFEPTERGATEYKWKLGDSKKWTVWFNAVGGNRKSYKAESEPMSLELVEGVSSSMWWNMGGMFTGMGAAIIGGLVLVIIMATTILSCIFCKCCKACRACSCMKDKCKRTPKEDKVEANVEGEMEGEEGETPNVENDVEMEEFDYAPKPRTGRLRKAGTLNNNAGASPPGSP